MANEFNTWKEAMKAWLKELIKWQQENPEKDYRNGICAEVTTQDEGSNPPPPPPPPGHG